ncbi:MAG: adenylate/guanylate cyclase domain-containing protein [Ferruginibacter sp.]
MNKLPCLIFLFCLLMQCSFSQNRYTDSLEAELKKHNAHKLEMGKVTPSMYDTAATFILNELADYYSNFDFEKAISYSKQAFSLSEQIGFNRGVGAAYNNMSRANVMKGDYTVALDLGEKALKIFEGPGGSRRGIGLAHGNLGSIYITQNNYAEALKHLYAALKINEEVGNKTKQAENLSTIGDIDWLMLNKSEALKHYLAASKISEEIGDKITLANNKSTIGRLYAEEKKYPEALKFQLEAVKIYEAGGDKLYIAFGYSVIGETYLKQGNYPEALKYEMNALKLNKEVGNINNMGFSYHNLGRTYTKTGEYNKASECLDSAMSLIKEPEGIKLIHYDVYVLDSAMGKYKDAFEHFKAYTAMKDSALNNENVKKTTQLQMQNEFDKKEASTKAGNEKELQKQKWVRNGFIAGFGIVLLFAGVFFRQRNKTKKQKQLAEEEKKRSEDLLLNILPLEVAEEIKATGRAKTKAFTMVTVMLTDFKDFTTVSEKISAELLVEEVHTCFSAFDDILHKYKIEKIKTIGDAYLCASGLPVSNYTHAADMLHAAFEIRDFMLQRKKEKESRGEIPFEIRIGIHTGPVVAGIVGVKKYAYDIWGDTVNLAARMEQNSEAGKINISGATYELVKNKFNCFHRGKIQAKNKGEIDMYFVERSEIPRGGVETIS